MATTTAAISALQTIEIIKVLKKNLPLASYKNSFVNLAVPFTMHSEPGECEKIKLGLREITLWTRWSIPLTPLNSSIGGLIHHLEVEYNLTVTGIK